VERAKQLGHEVAACALLVGKGMPDWSLAEIVAVHFRMHQAEGELFRDALARAVEGCALRLVAVPEKGLELHAGQALAEHADRLLAQIEKLGRSIGPPWGKDQKQAALAALVALKS
jgi:hypothetical protein